MADTPNETPTPSTIDQNFINEPGDVITEYITVMAASGQVFDISNFVLSTTLYEDIFANTLSGYLTILDAADLFNLVQFQGLEYVTFSFRTPSFTEVIAKTFKIVTASDRLMTSADREQLYTLNFISMEAVIDNVVNLTKKFSGTTDAVVEKIWNDNLTWPRFGLNTAPTPVFRVDQTPHASTVSFVAASWTPLKAINWVANRSFRTAGEAPTFLLYETNKAFYFRNIEEVIDTQVKNKQIYARYGYFPGAAVLPTTDINPAVIYTKPDLMKQYNLVRNMKSFNVFDILKGQDKGFYAAKLLTHDIGLKTFTESFFDYYLPYSKEVTPNKNTKAFPQSVFRNAECHQTVRTQQYKLFNDSNDPLYSKWTLQRNSLMYELSDITLEIEVAGRTDIEAGKIIEFLYPRAIDKPTGMTVDNALDDFITAFYLITSIRHTFSLNTHTMTLEIVRFI